MRELRQTREPFAETPAATTADIAPHDALSAGVLSPRNSDNSTQETNLAKNEASRLKYLYRDKRYL